MNALYRNLSRTSAITWQDQVAEIKQALKDRARLAPIMTLAERQQVSEYLGGLKEQYHPTIETGALEVWEGAKTNLKSAINNVEIQRRKIVNSWDDSKLAPMMQVYSMRIDVAAENADLDALQRISQDAKNSGDPYKVRACSEMLGNLVKKIPPGTTDSHGVDMRLAANRIAKQAGRDLASLETTPELAAAHEQAAAKVAELNAAKKLLYDAAEILGETAPNGNMMNSNFIKALESVTQDGEGNFVIKE